MEYLYGAIFLVIVAFIKVYASYWIGAVLPKKIQSIPTKKEGELTVLRFTTVYKFVMGVFSLAFLFSALMGIYDSYAQGGLLILFTMPFFAILIGFSIAILSAFSKVKFDEDNVYVYSVFPWKENKIIPWSEIEFEAYSEGFSSNNYKTKSGYVIHISDIYIGANEFVSFYNSLRADSS